MDHVLRTRIDSLFSSLSIVYVDNQAVEIDGLEVILFPLEEIFSVFNLLSSLILLWGRLLLFDFGFQHISMNC